MASTICGGWVDEANDRLELRRFGGNGSFFIYPTKRPSEAERYVEEVLRTNKRRAFPNFVLGITRLVQGNPQGAIAALREATRLEVRTAVFHHALGAAYAVSSDSARAERSFRAALALSPDSIESWRALCAVLIAENRADEVLEILGDRVQSRSDDIESRELLAQTYLQLEKYASARTQLTHVLSVFGDRLSPSQRSRFHTNIATTFLLQKVLPSAEREA
jgi:cytochrome c-type biogenesis protein CcmH/NrfG